MRAPNRTAFPDGYGENLAALYTVVATCIAHEIDPLAYLTDVLMR